MKKTGKSIKEEGYATFINKSVELLPEASLDVGNFVYNEEMFRERHKTGEINVKI